MRIGVYGMIAIALAGFYAYREFDKRVNFRPIDARVSSVKEQCYMEKTEDNRSSTSDLLPCELVELLARNHPKWQGADIKATSFRSRRRGGRRTRPAPTTGSTGGSAAMRRSMEASSGRVLFAAPRRLAGL